MANVYTHFEFECPGGNSILLLKKKAALFWNAVRKWLVNWPTAKKAVGQ